MWGTKLRHIRKTLVKLVSRTRRHSSREFDQLFPEIHPGIVDQDVDAIESFEDIVFELANLLLVRDVRLKGFCRSAAASTSSFTAFSCSRSRETSARFAPADPSARAMALPRPLLAPVMTATLPWRSYSFIGGQGTGVAGVQELQNV